MKITYPKGEISWVAIHNADGTMTHLITSKPTRDFYYIYEVKDGSLIKLGRDRNPTALERKFIKP